MSHMEACELVARSRYIGAGLEALPTDMTNQISSFHGIFPFDQLDVPDRGATGLDVAIYKGTPSM